MLTCHGISRWTNSNRSMAIHICKEYNHLPLCGKTYFTYEFDTDQQFDISKVTCKRCLSKYNALTKKDSNHN